MSDISYEIISQSETGRRARNEDSVLERVFTPEEHGTGAVLLAVADGVGGSVDGNVASQLATEVLGERWETFVQSRELPAASSTRSFIEEAYATVNSALKAHTQLHPNTLGMGTTLVAGFIVGNRLIVANVGDSRAYLYDPRSDSELTQITRDHSALEEALNRGVTREEASRSAFRHALTRVMDGGDNAEVDIYPTPDGWIDISDGGIVLACSDGLSGFLSEETIKATLREKRSLEAASESLVNQALRSGSTDNISVVLASVRGRTSKRRTKKDNSSRQNRVSIAQRIRTAPSSRIAVLLLLSAFLIVSLAMLIALVLVVYRP